MVCHDFLSLLWSSFRAQSLYKHKFMVSLRVIIPIHGLDQQYWGILILCGNLPWLVVSNWICASNNTSRVLWHPEIVALEEGEILFINVDCMVGLENSNEASLVFHFNHQDDASWNNLTASIYSISGLQPLNGQTSYANLKFGPSPRFCWAQNWSHLILKCASTSLESA